MTIHFEFLVDRLQHVYHENPSLDFMIVGRQHIGTLRKCVDSYKTPIWPLIPAPSTRQDFTTDDLINGLKALRGYVRDLEKLCQTRHDGLSDRVRDMTEKHHNSKEVFKARADGLLSSLAMLTVAMEALKRRQDELEAQRKVTPQVSAFHIERRFDALFTRLNDLEKNALLFCESPVRDPERIDRAITSLTKRIDHLEVESGRITRLLAFVRKNFGRDSI